MMWYLILGIIIGESLARPTPVSERLTKGQKWALIIIGTIITVGYILFTGE